MKRLPLNILFAFLVFGGSSVAFALTPPDNSEIIIENDYVACTQEVKQCPDGSFVGRMGPRCEFAKCPGATTTEVRKIKSALEIKRENLEKEKMQARLASSSAKRVEMKEEVKNRIEARVASTSAFRLEKRFEKIARNYLKEVVRLEQILGRVVTRIEKIKSLGGNTAEAEKYVEEARTHLSEARKTYDVLKTIATNIDNNATTTREMITSMKTSGKTVEEHLRLAHKALQKTVGSLRGNSQLNNASSTTTTSN